MKSKTGLFFLSIVVCTMITSNAHSASWWNNIKSRFSSMKTQIFRTQGTLKRKERIAKIPDPHKQFKSDPGKQLENLIYHSMKKNDVYCMDTDGGNPTQFNESLEKRDKGTVYYFWINPTTHKIEFRHKVDTCKSDKYLEDHSCAGYKWEQNSIGLMSLNENVLMKSVTCADDEVCSNGRCASMLCKDSDGAPLNFTTYGVVDVEQPDGTTSSIPDKCVNQRELSEGACFDDSYKENKVNCCDFGMVCTSGKCEYPSVSGVDLDSVCKEDLCKDVEGFQAEYLFDLDPAIPGPDSCTPFSGNVCSEPDPEDSYPDGNFYSHNGNLHIGFCMGEGKIFHTICTTNSDGSTSLVSDITECIGGMPCEKGECKMCTETDGGMNPEVYGELTVLLSGGFASSENDSCVLSGSHLIETSCEGDTFKKTYIPCDEGSSCKKETVDGITTIGCVEGWELSCVDTDGGINYDVYGEVTYVTPNGEEKTDADRCSPNAQLMYEMSCDGNAYKIGGKVCPAGTACERITENGTTTIGCFPIDGMSCSDTDGGENYDSFGTITYVLPDGEEHIEPDSCWGQDRIHEFFCDGVFSMETTKFCEGLTTCKNIMGPYGIIGVGCFPVCFKLGDADDAVEVAGVVYDHNNDSYPDYCEGNVLKQYSCNGDQKIDLPPYTCPNGCANGACIQ